MEHKYYLPVSDADKALWLNAFAAALVIFAGTLGLTAAQVGAVLADAGYFSAVLNALPGYKDYFKTLTSYKDALRDGSPTAIGAFPAAPAAPAIAPVSAGVFKRTTELVRTIKAHPAYNRTMGEALGIIGAEIPDVTDTIQPHPSVKLKNSHAYLKWKHEHTDAADVYADYGDGAGFVYVARILKAHYLDPHLPAAGQSKIYKYKLRYIVNDEAVGVESDPVSVTVTG